jgi:hypothetical protein
VTFDRLLAKLHNAGIRLRADDGQLAISGSRARLDASLMADLRLHKPALLDMIERSDKKELFSPLIITPDLVVLVDLPQAAIDAVVATVAGGAANVQDIYPLVPLQEGILFHHLLTPAGDPYVSRQLIRCDARSHLDAYLAALRAVIARHDLLRTAVVWEEVPEPVQVVWRDAPLRVETVELDPADGDVGEQLYRRFDPTKCSFDIRQAPLFRVHVAAGVAGEWFLLLRWHHLISDHQTAEILGREVMAHLAGEERRLRTPVPFREFVAQGRLGPNRAAHEAFFRALLGDVTEPTLPFGLVDVQGDGSTVAEHPVDVEPRLGERLREQAQALGVSPASVWHIAWAQVLARASGRDDVVFGTVLLGRMQGGAGIDRAFGVFINTLPVRLPAGAMGVATAVRAAHQQLAAVVAHEHASLALAQRCSGVPAPAPLFSAILNYRHTANARRAERPATPPMIRSIVSEERTNYPLMLSVDDLANGFRLSVQVTGRIDPARVCRLVTQAAASVVAALEDAPDTPLRQVTVLPPAERTQVVAEWNATAVEYPADVCVHEAVEAQVARTPGAVAVVFEPTGASPAGARRGPRDAGRGLSGAERRVGGGDLGRAQGGGRVCAARPRGSGGAAPVSGERQCGGRRADAGAGGRVAGRGPVGGGGAGDGGGGAGAGVAAGDESGACRP